MFAAQGYARTQMADVAEAVGVSKATLYRYVESKGALLYVCLFHADDPSAFTRPAVLPVPTSLPGVMAADLAAGFAEIAQFPALWAALNTKRAPNPRGEETVATWAMHIKWDPAPEPYEPVSTKELVIEQVSHGLLPEAAFLEGKE